MIYNLLEGIQKRLIEIEFNTVSNIKSILRTVERSQESNATIKAEIKLLQLDIADLKRKVEAISQKYK